jgi:hypothetical protein
VKGRINSDWSEGKGEEEGGEWGGKILKLSIPQKLKTPPGLHPPHVSDLAETPSSWWQTCTAANKNF